MARHRVKSIARSDAPAAAAWSVLRDFCAPWHPLVATMTRELTPNGHLVRAFTVAGEDAVYRERLTWFSDSDRSMAYTHVAGIEGVERYVARLEVLEKEQGCEIVMSAELSAEEPRAGRIAEGTQAIFDMGTAEAARLAQAAPPQDRFPARAGGAVPEIGTRFIDGTPRLAVSHVPGPSQDLCLFLHGIGGNRANWNGQLSALAGRHAAAAMDLRGYGDSAPGTAQSTVDDHCDDILRVADALGAGRLVLCGLSFGAWIATTFATRYPDRLAGLVLAGGCTGMSEASDGVRNGFRAARLGPLDEGRTPADFADEVVGVIAGPDAGDALRAALRASMAAIRPATYRDAVNCFTSPAERFDFAQFSMPVLMMTGAHDRLAPPAEIGNVARRIHAAAAVPDVRFEVLAGVGHVCNLEAPSAFDGPLSVLLDRVFT